MPDQTEEIVGSIGIELVSRLAPEELPLYPSLLRQFQGTDGARGKASDDQILGFGAAEAMALMTPMILGFARSFWAALMAQAAETAIHGVLGRFQRGHKRAQADAAPLTTEQLRLVRAIAEQEARRLDVPDGQAGLLADAVVGILAAPPVS